MTVNGTAYPVLHVKRRRYRLRFLDASISRIYNLQLMTSPRARTPRATSATRATSCRASTGSSTGSSGRSGTRSPTRAGCCPGRRPRLVRAVAGEAQGVRRRLQREQTARTTSKDNVYLVNTMKMTTGRMWDSADPKYEVPLMKIIIDNDPVADNSAPVSVLSATLRRRPRPTSTRRAGRVQQDQRQEHPDVRAPARQRGRRPRDGVADQRPAVRSHQADDLRQPRLRHDVAGPQRRRRLGPPHAPPHGGAPDRGAQRQGAEHATRGTSPTTAPRRTWSPWTRARRPSSRASSGPSPARTWPTATTWPTRTTT